MTREASAALLSIRDLSVTVASPDGPLPILEDVSFDVPAGASVAIVGESGSGKSLTAFSILGLLPVGAEITRGSVALEGRELTSLADSAYRKVRGAQIGMIFQEPSTALDPVYTIGSQLVEAIQMHRRVSGSEAKKIAVEWLARVGMPQPSSYLGSYPHELSGGLRQRVMIALALVAGPKLVIADEPTTALDRTLEAQILALLAELSQSEGTAMLFVSHDLAVVSQITDQMVVLYAGQVVERGPTSELLDTASHPYTQALVECFKGAENRPPRVRGSRSEPLPMLPGAPPSFDALPTGCRFSPRCPHVMDRCTEEEPPLYEVRPGRTARCFLIEGDEEAS